MEYVQNLSYIKGGLKNKYLKNISRIILSFCKQTAFLICFTFRQREFCGKLSKLDQSLKKGCKL